MKRKLKAMFVLTFVLCFISSSALVMASPNESSYTYNYDFWEDYRASADVYRVMDVLDYQSLGLDKSFNNPQGLFVKDNMIYVCDTGNNRIVQIERVNNEFHLVRVIDSFTGDTDPLTFANPSDIYVTNAGELFICDTDNNRVVKLDKDLNFKVSFIKPTDTTFDQSLSYLPSKVVVDQEGRAFVMATNVNKGLVKYENDGTFTGFVGAAQVKYEWYDYIWKMLSTKAQRAQQASFVPTEYDNMYMDEDGFIYAVTTMFNVKEWKDGTAKPIRRLNALGNDILVQNGNYDVKGDLNWNDEDSGSLVGPSKLIDITALENDNYIAIDRVRGRLFGYDSQGNMLFVFGGYGNMDGYFRSPTAIEHMGHDILVLDSQDNSITVFQTTQYGENIYKAIDLYQKGEYEESANVWRDVLKVNGNYDLAYIGVGRSLLRQGNYKRAMEYFKLTWDGANYSKAFKLYRKEWIEDHIVPIFLGFFLILGTPLLIGKVKRVKEEVDRA